MSQTYYRSRRNGLYYDGPGSRNVVADPTKVQPSAPLVAWGISLLILGSILAGVGLGMEPTTDLLGRTTDPGVAWTWMGVVAQAVGGIILAVGAYRAAVGIDNTHRLSRHNAIKDRIVDID